MGRLSGLSLLTVAGRGWDDAREIRVADVSASWQINGAGRLSAVAASRDLWLLGIDVFLDCWVRWEHPTMGIWGGLVDTMPISLGAGTVELSCASFVADMRKRRTKKRYRQVSAPAGSLVRRAFTDIAANDLAFDRYHVDTDGDPIAMQWRGDDLFSVVDRLAKASNHQYDATLNADGTIDFWFRRQVGWDLTGSIELYEGYQVADGSITPSTANLVNDRLAIAAEGSWDTAISAVAQDPVSIQRYRRRQDTARYYGAGSRAALSTRGKVDLQTLGKPVIPISLTLSDREPLLAEIRQGDTIRVGSASANAHYLVTVTGRAVRASSGQVTLVGDAEVAA